MVLRDAFDAIFSSLNGRKRKRQASDGDDSFVSHDAKVVEQDSISTSKKARRENVMDDELNQHSASVSQQQQTAAGLTRPWSMPAVQQSETIQTGTKHASMSAMTRSDSVQSIAQLEEIQAAWLLEKRQLADQAADRERQARQKIRELEDQVARLQRELEAKPLPSLPAPSIPLPPPPPPPPPMMTTKQGLTKSASTGNIASPTAPAPPPPNFRPIDSLKNARSQLRSTPQKAVNQRMSFGPSAAVDHSQFLSELKTHRLKRVDPPAGLSTSKSMPDLQNVLKQAFVRKFGSERDESVTESPWTPIKAVTSSQETITPTVAHVVEIGQAITSDQPVQLANQGPPRQIKPLPKARRVPREANLALLQQESELSDKTSDAAVQHPAQEPVLPVSTTPPNHLRFLKPRTPNRSSGKKGKAAKKPRAAMAESDDRNAVDEISFL